MFDKNIKFSAVNLWERRFHTFHEAGDKKKFQRRCKIWSSMHKQNSIRRFAKRTNAVAMDIVIIPRILYSLVANKNNRMIHDVPCRNNVLTIILTKTTSSKLSFVNTSRAICVVNLYGHTNLPVSHRSTPTGNEPRPLFSFASLKRSWQQRPMRGPTHRACNVLNYCRQQKPNPSGPVRIIIPLDHC